ncbi:MG2 domain-containing protein [Flavobacterium sp. I3-2]|uniref:MG2 domain-containing protein n=1 Tax=Flavobacterium sp. I3-2 TaxID=2748319 RepID=UPI0015AC0DF2|nr:MG2 domain-containing protein [Flavobacterium sp. I3-2]
MKNVLLLFLLQISFSVFSQNYEKQWNKIYETEAKGNIKEAYEAVLKIEKKAQRNKNEQEFIKVFLFKSKYENILFDKRHSDFFVDINTQIANANGNSVYFYNYIKAAYLAAYFNKYQSDIQRRGDSKNISNQSNFTEWHQRDFINALTSLYNETFSDSEKLQAIPLSDYKEVVEGFGNVNQEHLYEFLLEKWMLLPIAQLYVNAEPSSYEFYADYKDSFLTRDLSDNFDVRLTAYQMLENFYKQEQKIYDYERVKFMRFQQNFLLNDLQLLDVLIATTSTNEFKNKYRLEKLSYLVGEANAKEKKSYLKEAIQLIDTLKTQEISITDLNQILNLEKSIKQQRLIVYNEPILYNNQHNKILVDFKNIDTLYNFVYKVDDLEMFNQLKSDSLYFDYLKTHKPFQNIESVMPNQGDFNSYTTEVLLPDFEEGYYFLVSSYEKTVTENTPSVRFNPFVVTDVFIVYKQFDKNLEIQLLNRKTGKPLSETKVFVFDKFYTSDENGFVKIKINKDTFDRKANYDVLVYSNDFIYQETFSGSQFYFSNYSNDEDEERQITSFIYTDRGLYRPGQEVYFKAILVQTIDGFKRKAAENIKVNVQFEGRDYSDNNILTTNEFGSVSGKFVIPKNVDDGEFEISVSKPDDLTKSEEKIWETIDLEDNYVYLEVAEYKRNTYEVNFNPYQENIEIGETIMLSGSVKSFSNASIANAKVTITPSHWLYNNYSQSKIINYPIIETFTDSNGNFEFPFTFAKDSLTQKDLNTQIEYYFTAEVVDNSGEVREAHMQISYNTKPFLITYQPDSNTFYKNEEKYEVEIKTSTINGKFVPTKGKVKVYKRQGIRKFELENLWMKPTIQIIDSLTLTDKFPYQSYAYDFYRHESKLVFEQEYETKENEKFVLDEKLFDLGEYYLEFIPNDSLFTPAKHKFNFSVFDYTYHRSVSIEIDEEKSLRSKKLQLKIFSKVPEVYVNLDLNYLGNQNKSFLIHLKQGENFVELPIDIENRDIRFKSNLYFVYENRLFKEFVEISFPYRKDYSTIKTEILHLNDKLNPGDDYNWKLKVFNQNKPKDKLEVLATMYDFSLDAIHNERWDNFYFYDYGSSNLASVLNQTTNFVDTEIYYNSKSQFSFKKSNLTSILNFNWFGFRFF